MFCHPYEKAKGSPGGGVFGIFGKDSTGRQESGLYGLELRGQDGNADVLLAKDFLLHSDPGGVQSSMVPEVLK